MKINAKLILGFLAIASLIGVVGWIGFHSSQQIAVSYDRLKQYDIRVDAAAEVSSYAKRAEGHLFLYLALDTEVDREKFFLRHASLEEQIAILEEEAVLPEVREQVAMAKSFSAEILEYGNQLLQIYDANPEAFDFKDQAELIVDLHDSTSGARKAGVAIVDLETSALNGDIEQAIGEATVLQQGIILSIVLTIALAQGAGLFISRSISRPIGKLRDAADSFTDLDKTKFLISSRRQ